MDVVNYSEVNKVIFKMLGIHRKLLRHAMKPANTSHNGRESQAIEKL